MKKRSKAMKLAHAIKKQNQFLDWGKCQVQAWKVIHLKEAMQESAIIFTYQKQNGEVRKATGTLNKELFDYTPKGRSGFSPVTAIKYFDCDKNAFRCFRAERILSIAA